MILKNGLKKHKQVTKWLCVKKEQVFPVLFENTVKVFAIFCYIFFYYIYITLEYCSQGNSSVLRMKMT